MLSNMILKFKTFGCFFISAFFSAGAFAQPAPEGADDSIRGVVKAQQEALLSAGINARVQETPVYTGESFSEGDLLIRFDCEAEKAEAQAAYAAYSAAKARHESNVEMQSSGAVGQFEVKLSKAEMQQASAQARAIKARTKTCELHAPFDGKVAELGVNAFETPSPDQPLIKIVASNALELRLIIPSNWLGWVEPGAKFIFTVDETETAHKASVTRIGAEVDAVSRTVPIIAMFDEMPEKVLPGMSGSAKFSQAMR